MSTPTATPETPSTPHTTRILLSASERKQLDYHKHASAALDALNIDYELSGTLPPESVDYILYAPNSALQNFTPYTRCKAVFNLWAGVESVVTNPTLTCPLARMVDPGLKQGMTEWVCAHVLRYHLGMDQHILNHDHQWLDDVTPPLASARTITLLGMGQLGTTCANQLLQLGFNVRGWSQSPKELPGVTHFVGQSQLLSALDNADMVVLLLPDTPNTQNILCTESLTALKRGAFVLNPGRGPLIHDEDLITALDTGHIAHATLDVFRQEPLPKTHPFWSHPKVTITPHIAAEIRAETAAPVLAENIRRAISGEPLMHLVDRKLGY